MFGSLQTVGVFIGRIEGFSSWQCLLHDDGNNRQVIGHEDRFPANSKPEPAVARCKGSILGEDQKGLNGRGSI